jgi:hypothetical protein
VVARMNLIKGAISGDERRHPSGGEDELGRDEVIGGHPRSSEVIRGHQRSSELIGAHRSSAELIRAHRSSSELIGAHQRTYLGVMPCTVWVTARASTGAANE